MKPNCNTNYTFPETKMLNDTIPMSVPMSSASDTASDHSFSQQCKLEQLKRYKAFIDDCLKSSDKQNNLPNNEADLQTFEHLFSTFPFYGSVRNQDNLCFM